MVDVRRSQRRVTFVEIAHLGGTASTKRCPPRTCCRAGSSYASLRSSCHRTAPSARGSSPPSSGVWRRSGLHVRARGCRHVGSAFDRSAGMPGIAHLTGLPRRRRTDAPGRTGCWRRRCRMDLQRSCSSAHHHTSSLHHLGSKTGLRLRTARTGLLHSKEPSGQSVQRMRSSEIWGFVRLLHPLHSGARTWRVEDGAFVTLVIARKLPGTTAGRVLRVCRCEERRCRRHQQPAAHAAPRHLQYVGRQSEHISTEPLWKQLCMMSEWWHLQDVSAAGPGIRSAS